MAPFTEDQPIQTKLVYDIDYFISKFEVIPADHWCEGDFTNRDGQQCALGHCGIGRETKEIDWTDEGTALFKIAPDIMPVNDGGVSYTSLNNFIKGNSPKERVLFYLRAIKEGRI